MTLGKIVADYFPKAKKKIKENKEEIIGTVMGSGSGIVAGGYFWNRFIGRANSGSIKGKILGAVIGGGVLGHVGYLLGERVKNNKKEYETGSEAGTDGE